jgi:hypothetical protein
LLSVVNKVSEGRLLFKYKIQDAFSWKLILGILSDTGLEIIIKVLSASFLPDRPIAQTQNLGTVIHTLDV